MTLDVDPWHFSYFPRNLSIASHHKQFHQQPYPLRRFLLPWDVWDTGGLPLRRSGNSLKATDE